MTYPKATQAIIERDALRDGIESALPKGALVGRAIVIAEVERMDKDIELIVWAFQGDNPLPEWSIQGMLEKAFELLSDDG